MHFSITRSRVSERAAADCTFQFAQCRECVFRNTGLLCAHPNHAFGIRLAGRLFGPAQHTDIQLWQLCVCVCARARVCELIASCVTTILTTRPPKVYTAECGWRAGEVRRETT